MPGAERSRGRGRRAVPEGGAGGERDPRPLSVYVHIPFCLAKCGYCDFNSYAVEGLIALGRAGEDWAPRYADAILREIEGRCRSLGLEGRRAETVFFGGGTPSLMPPEETARILDALGRTFRLAPGAEVTVEANPGAADAARFAALGEAGVNRISIGVQSFDDEALRRLDRVHTGEEARAAFRAAREAGFGNISLDLMFGIPFQTPGAARADIESALDLGPEHLSAYELTIEPGTAFHALHSRGELRGLPDEETALAMWRLRDRLLARAGFERYEISNFARPGRRCRHNLNYWRRGEYLGLGAGAHSFLGKRRLWNHARPDIYQARAEDPTAGEEILDDAAKALGEALMLGLRLKEGVSLGAIARACGADPEEQFGPLFEELRGGGLLERENGTLRLTPRGTLLANRVLARFL
ncbi:MAG: radical SAM family heme chaperone HemW [Candidatus Tectomicrobia bacterium]|nr:radical SAM family heme chaperone HemW [Candidatus Tectomicrobia bacterium]